MYFDAGFSDKQHHDMMQKVRYIYILEQMAFQHIYVMSVGPTARQTLHSSRTNVSLNRFV